MQQALDLELASAPRDSVPEEADLELPAVTILSRFLAGTTAKNPTATNRLCRGLALCGRVRTAEDRKSDRPAPCSSLPLKGWPTAEKAQRVSGLSQAQLCERYFDAVDDYGVNDARLDDDLVDLYVPRKLWPVVAHLLAEGPAAAAERVRLAVREYAQMEVPGDRYRASSPPSTASVKDMQAVFGRLLRMMTELRAAKHPHPLFEPWIVVPRIPLPKIKGVGRDTSAPRPELARAVLASMDRAVADALGVAPGGDEMAAIMRKNPRALCDSPVFQVIRNRAAFILLVLTGGRVGAVSALRRSDYVSEHQGVPPDYRGGAAVYLYPGKNIDQETRRVKVIPGDAARRIDAYLLWLEVGLAAANRKLEVLYKRQEGLPPTHLALPDDFPLLVSNRTRFRSFGPQGMRVMVTGREPYNGQSGRRPLIAREKGVNPELPSELHQYIGYPPHSYRHLAEQLAERAGEIWNKEHPPTGGSAPFDPGLYASALLDHNPAMDQMRALYGDRRTEETYELLSGRAIEVMWELLMTDRGLRRRRNEKAIRESAAELRAVEGDLVMRHRRISQLHASPVQPLPPKIVRTPLATDAGAEEKLDRLLQQAEALLERQDLLHVRVHGFESAFRELHELDVGCRLLESRRQELHVEITRLWFDEDRWEAVPDSAPPGAEHVDLDFDALIRGSDEGRAKEIGENSTACVRNWVIPAELAWIAGVNRSTVARWLKGEALDVRSDRRPWDPDAIPVDESEGLNYRRIWLGGLRPQFWVDKLTRQRAQAIRERWPKEQGWTIDGEPGQRCLAPLQLPDAVSRERASDATEASNGGAQHG